MESPIVARTHSGAITMGQGLKTPAFIVNHKQQPHQGLEDSIDVDTRFPGFGVGPQLTQPKTPKFATSARVGQIKVESTEEREMREIREAQERKRLEKAQKRERMQRALQGEPISQTAPVAPLPLTQPQSPKFATDARAQFSRSSEQQSNDNISGGNQEDEEALPDTRNQMFFTVGGGGKPLVDRKFQLRSDRRALARQRKDSPPKPKEDYVGLAERLHKVQQQEAEEGVEDGAGAGVISIAPFRPTVPKTPKFATAQRVRVNTAAPALGAHDDDHDHDHDDRAPAFRPQVAVHQPIERPALTVGKTPNFATKHRARREPLAALEADDQPSKKFRTNAAGRAARDGGAIGVPMIPKAALTRPEEFDFATAARSLAAEDGSKFRSTAKKPKKQRDAFEQAAMDVAFTSNKIGMYVDLDTNLDQDVAVAKLATTGRKRNPGKSRFAMEESDEELVQPDFGIDDSSEAPAVVRGEGNNKKKNSHPAQQEKKRERVEPPALTIPKTPKFATTARAASRPKPREPSPERVKEPVQQKPRVQEHPQAAAAHQYQLTIPQAPRFHTEARAKAHPKPEPKEEHFVQQQQQQPARVASATQVVRQQPALTEPKPFSFATDSRFKKQQPAAAFDAAPAQKQPVFHADKYSTALGLTEPKPFSFATDSRLGQKRVENDHPNQVPRHDQQHHQHNPFGLTEPQPFNLRVEQRGALAREVLEKKVREEEEERIRKANFRAKPFVEAEPPAYQPRAFIPPTKAQDVVLNSEVRAARRQEFEAQERQRRQEDERLAREREKERARREAEEIKEMRKRMVPKVWKRFFFWNPNVVCFFFDINHESLLLHRHDLSRLTLHLYMHRAATFHSQSQSLQPLRHQEDSIASFEAFICD